MLELDALIQPIKLTAQHASVMPPITLLQIAPGHAYVRVDSFSPIAHVRSLLTVQQFRTPLIKQAALLVARAARLMLQIRHVPAVLTTLTLLPAARSSPQRRPALRFLTRRTRPTVLH